MALPAYQGYVKKAKFAEVISISDGYKTAVALCMTDLGVAAGCTAGTNGIPANPAATGNLLDGGTVTNGVISLTGVAGAGSYTYIATPTNNAANSAIIWTQTGSCQAAGACK